MLITARVCSRPEKITTQHNIKHAHVTTTKTYINIVALSLSLPPSHLINNIFSVLLKLIESSAAKTL